MENLGGRNTKKKLVDMERELFQAHTSCYVGVVVNKTSSL
jgi:hypothetical protein